MAISLYRGQVSVVSTGGQPVIVAYGPVLGGFIVNPMTPIDQGIGTIEILYVDVVNPADTYETETTFAIQPGGLFTIPPNITTNVTVNAASSGHKFNVVLFQPATPYPPTPPAGPFPPSGPTTLTNVIPSYLYQEYSDDEDLQAFVSAYNALAQQYVTWFATSKLPVYVGTNLTGALLDWVALGLYGITRPSLSSGRNRNLGLFNTYRFNTLVFNGRKVIGPQNVTQVTDDLFKRIMTWDLYRGDGRTFSIRWLKRRIMRFLLGENGTAPNVDNTEQVSITFGVGNQVNITLLIGTRKWVSGSRFNKFKIGQGIPYNEVVTVYAALTPLPNTAVFKEAADNGILQLPFQYSYVITV